MISLRIMTTIRTQMVMEDQNHFFQGLHQESNLLGSCISLKINLTGEDDEPCIYLCTTGGGCQVRYAGPAQDGSTVGNCFSKAFGGSCSGTPRGCRDCNKAVKCEKNGSDGDNRPAPGM